MPWSKGLRRWVKVLFMMIVLNFQVILMNNNAPYYITNLTTINGNNDHI